MMKMIWKEIDQGENVNSFRRNIQNQHIEILITIMLNNNNRFPSDAVALSRDNLNNIYKKIQIELKNEKLDKYTFVHYTQSANQIYSAYTAKTVSNSVN